MVIGSVWCGKKSVQQAVFLTKKFSVNYSKKMWRFCSFQSAEDNNSLKLYPGNKLGDMSLVTKLAKFLNLILKDEGRLVVPCLEYFTKVWGFSDKLRQIVLDDKWEARTYLSNRLCAPWKALINPGEWNVRLTENLVWCNK